VQDELDRVMPVLDALAERGFETPISIDTYKAGVARAACEAGAVIVNDVTGASDPGIVPAAAEAGAAYVLTYHRGAADPEVDAAREMLTFFEKAIAQCEADGLPRDHIILDPGVGFAKTYEQNFQVLGAVDGLVRTGLPVLIGVSRKSFIGRLTGNPVGERLVGTLAAGRASVYRGASVLRGHDVAAHREALDMSQAIRSAK